jgi:hypothetical protein
VLAFFRVPRIIRVPARVAAALVGPHVAEDEQAKSRNSG